MPTPVHPDRSASPAQRAGQLVLALVAALVLFVGLPAAPASAEPLAATFAVEASVAADGSATVTETITFEGEAPAELEQRLERRENVPGDLQYEFSYDQVSATAGGQPADAAVDTSADFVTITVPTAGASEVAISYTVTGAATRTADGSTQMRLLLLQGLSIPVREFTATVEVPGAFSELACTAGAPGSDRKCRTAQGGTQESVQPTFTDGPRGAGEIVLVKITFPQGVVAPNERLDHRWTVARAFTPGLAQLLSALAVLLVGAVVVFVLHRRRGVDAQSGQVARVAEFTPVGQNASRFTPLNDIHPGHVGTLHDERVDPIDITASLLNLAVRGHLRITELPSGEFARTEWTLTRLAAADGDLRPFETKLLDAVGTPGTSVSIADLAGSIGEHIGDIQGALYDEVVDRGWYDHRPDETRNTWSQFAVVLLILGVAATGVLAAFTTFGLLGLAVVIVGLALMYVAQEMPARTADGVAVRNGLEALRAELLTAPTDRMPKGEALSELSEVLPYAVVLGGADRWLDAIAATDGDDAPDSTDLDWYHGPDNWHLRNLPDSLRNFVTTASGLLFSR